MFPLLKQIQRKGKREKGVYSWRRRRGRRCRRFGHRQEQIRAQPDAVPHRQKNVLHMLHAKLLFLFFLLLIGLRRSSRRRHELLENRVAFFSISLSRSALDWNCEEETLFGGRPMSLHFLLFRAGACRLFCWFNGIDAVVVADVGHVECRRVLFVRLRRRRRATAGAVRGQRRASRHRPAPSIVHRRRTVSSRDQPIGDRSSAVDASSGVPTIGSRSSVACAPAAFCCCRR